MQTATNEVSANAFYSVTRYIATLPNSFIGLLLLFLETRTQPRYWASCLRRLLAANNLAAAQSY